jgi:hypothetical protein
MRTGMFLLAGFLSRHCRDRRFHRALAGDRWLQHVGRRCEGGLRSVRGYLRLTPSRLRDKDVLDLRREHRRDRKR